MVVLASGIARGRVRTSAATATTELRKMAAISTPNNKLTETCNLVLHCTSMISDIHVMINYKAPIDFRGISLATLCHLVDSYHAKATVGMN